MDAKFEKSVVSLFSGIGGFDLGFHMAGFKLLACVEKDANCIKLLSAKWPGVPVLEDVCMAGKHNLPPCGVVTFGFPCQDLSIAGKRAGLAGGRSGLFYEAMRIIHELQPAYCLFENVPGLLSSDRGRDFARVLMEMEKIRYHGAWRVFDAQWFGVAQRRRRVFGLFSRLDSGAGRCAEILSLREGMRGNPPPSREAGQEVAGCITGGSDGGRSHGKKSGTDREGFLTVVKSGIMPADGTAPGHLLPVAFGGDVARTLTARHDSSPCADRGMDVVAVPVAFSCKDSGDDAGNISPTLRGMGHDASHANGGGQVAVTVPGDGVGMRARRLTPTECERLQGFPDGWTASFSDSIRYRMLGNAVCVNVAKWIAKRMAVAE